jgi:hypothetical protein
VLDGGTASTASALSTTTSEEASSFEDDMPKYTSAGSR